jgi:hypothetical protein
MIRGVRDSLSEMPSVYESKRNKSNEVKKKVKIIGLSSHAFQLKEAAI